MAQEGSVLREGRWWRMEVSADGIYRLTTAEVEALRDQPTASIAVYGGGAGMLSVYNSTTPTGDLQQVPIEIVDHNGNGTFDDADAILFHGEGADRWRYVSGDGRWEYENHAYATRNCYYLTIDATSQRLIATAPAVEATTEYTTHTAVTHVDNELVSLLGSGQQWLGEKFSATVPSRTVTLSLPRNAGGEVRMRYALASQAAVTCSFDMSATGYSNSVSISPQVVHVERLDALNTSAQSLQFSLTYHPNESAATGYLDFIELNYNASLTYSGGQMEVRDSRTATATARYRLGGQTAGVRVWDVSTCGKERAMAVSGGTWSDSCAEWRRYIVFDGNSCMVPTTIKSLPNQNLHGAAAAELVVVTHAAYRAQAERLAALHEIFDGMTTLVATDDEVYNEFSSGKQDPMALRALLRWLNEKYPSQAPRYMAIMGKATYDNRNLLGNDVPTVVTYESPNSWIGEGVSYCSDDIMGYLSPEGRGASTEILDVSVGRLPAKSLAEATHMVDKIEGYLSRRDLADNAARGDWRNYVALLADDADPGKPGDSLFAHSSEVVARSIKALSPHFNVEKLYADAYHQSTGAIGSFYPDLNNALRQRMNYGCLLLNYIGHGSTAYIGTERYIELSDIYNYGNTDRLPLFVTSTCSYGHYDLAGSDVCGAEACLVAPAAAIAVISASRPISHIERFNTDVVRYALDPTNTIGDALRMAKNRTTVSQCISLIGDPALRLSVPDNRVVVTSINGHAVDNATDDTATVLSRVTVCGEIHDSNGVLLSDFDGTIFPVVFDREMRTSTLANDNAGTEVDFIQQKSILYRGVHTVSGGRFEYSFIVPRDVAYQYAYCKLSHYARSGSDHAAGAHTRLMLGGLNDTADLSGIPAPTIHLYMGDTNFRSGGLTDASPTLLAHIYDSAGINAGAGLGHDITAVVDGQPGSMVVLNDLYQTDLEHPGLGSVAYTFSDIAPGRHTVTLKAWNIFNISAEASIDFVVANADTLAISDLRCYPNPASGQTRFILEANNTAVIAHAELQVYNTHGQPVFRCTPPVGADGYTVGPVVWDLGGVAPGLYIARLILTDSEGTLHQRTAKCVVH
jgi:hypothetical protein